MFRWLFSLIRNERSINLSINQSGSSVWDCRKGLKKIKMLGFDFLENSMLVDGLVYIRKREEEEEDKMGACIALIATSTYTKAVSTVFEEPRM